MAHGDEVVMELWWLIEMWWLMETGWLRISGGSGDLLIKKM